MIVQRECLQDFFESQWEKYVDVILRYARSHISPTKDLRHAMRDENTDEIGKQ